MGSPLVSIIIPHHKTEKLARLCLRSIRYYTRDIDYEVIVVDNNSQSDISLDYMKNVSWIKLIERKEVSKDYAQAHKEAMDIGISHSKAPYVLALHTDTIAIHPQWLQWLLSSMIDDETVGAVGSYKLEIKASWQIFFKKLEHYLCLNKTAAEGSEQNPLYIRSHCALYRKDLLTKLNLCFVSPDTAGRNIHFGLIEAGYQAKLHPIHEKLKYIVHLNHGTMVMRPELGARKKTIRKGLSRIERFMNSPKILQIYSNSLLDS